jgi:hypothetical protein
MTRRVRRRKSRPRPRVCRFWPLWAICAADARRRAWVLSVAQKADPHAAYHEYEKALEIDHQFAPTHNNLGLALKCAGGWDHVL